ncbi:MAG: oligosaccharide flippase family protein [Bacilli bacterium]|nr:oligosaccharide flippase family protein [Bacilli bacterium]
MKEKFIKSTIYLIIGGFITKLLGLFIKIITTRYIGIEGISMYTLILPTFSLAMTITQLSLPLSISKLISEDKYNNKNILASTLPISIIINILVITILILSSKYLATNLLHDTRCIYPIIAISLTLPFISLSSIIRSYFFGKQQMLPHVISNIIEQITRIIIIIIITPYLIKKSIIWAVCGLILSNIISEIISIIILILFIPKRKITKQDIIPNKNNIKNILNISIPNTSGRLITSIFYFFEPIIITYTLTKVGLNPSYITTEYGIIEGYVIPLITLPNFFTIAISNSLLPTLSNLYAKNKYKEIKKSLKQALFLSGIIGLVTVIILFIFPNFFLNLIYNTNHGKNYLLILLPVFILYYISPPLSTYLQATNKTKKLIKNEITGITIKTLSLLLFPLLNQGIYSLIIGIYLNIIITNILNIKEIKKSI